MSKLVLDAAVFSPAAIAPDTRMVNEAIIKVMKTIPDRWAVPLAEIRAARLSGKGVFPLSPESPRARDETIPGPRGDVPVRVYMPDGAPRGVYLHIHGGGWTVGSARENEGILDRIAGACGLAVVSVDYALAPEVPFPAGPDDCEAAALWLVREGKARFGTDRFAIGGESAGATLSVVTLARLRDRHRLSPFSAAVLTAGCYDLRLTPSARNWGDEPLVLNTRDILFFVNNYLRLDGKADEPDVSPLLGDLKGLPKALFTVGTRDALLDDTLFMANAWLAAGNAAALDVYPGGCHVFIGFPGTIADQAMKRICDYLSAF
ncbi:alpha/beta hydrolase [Xanthobacter autotrophicus]|uniref:alpha/beta hydrolase n=1 Tax=Xanthobacter TaxID=279 RepID=UPI0024AB7A7B|nr:alpha/beta hydrolase fold domain-containing protein [Xanthobacter autotrophicus]MDI4665007.1 alpha/beta hydrolase [Xanthobacter autotrophicus]